MMITLKKKPFFLLSVLYLYVPLMIFLFGWTKWWIAAICTISCLFCVIRFIQSTFKDTVCDEPATRIGILPFVISIILLLLFGYFAGWGRWVNQGGDWAKHNMVLEDLITKEWPVYYHNEEHTMLTYFVGQYLVPAVFGKVFQSFRVGEIVHFIYAEIGLFLVWANIIRILKVRQGFKQIIIPLIMLFFSIPLLLAQYIQWKVIGINILGDPNYLLNFIPDLQLIYLNNFVLLKEGFPQVLPIWLILLLFIENKNSIEHYLTIFLPGTLFGLLSFAGLIPLAIGHVIWIMVTGKTFWKTVKRIFSLENILMLVTILPIFTLFYYGNAASEKPTVIGLHLTHLEGHWISYFILVVVCILPYFLCVFNRKKPDDLLILSVLSLIVIPFVSMGLFNDFMMKVSIPAFFILMFSIIDHINSLKKPCKSSVKVKTSILVMLLLIGSYYPLQELAQSIRGEDFSSIPEYSSSSLEPFANRDADVSIDYKYNYFSYDIDSNIFYKYIARKQY